jgi:hypothetical protein
MTDYLSMFPVLQGRTNPGRLITLATKFCTLAPNIFSIFIAVLPLPLKKRATVYMHRAESAELHCIVQDAPEF